MSVNKRRYWTVAGIAFAIPVFLTIMDWIGWKMWGMVGGYGGEAYKTVIDTWMTLFWTFAWVLILIIPTIYYLFRKDWSETIALALIPAVLLSFGIEDILYYVFTQEAFWGTTMPWLWEHPFTGMKLVAFIMNQNMITSTTLVVSGIIGVLLSVGIAIGLYEYKKTK